MIGIGVNENVVLSSDTKINDKGSLVLSFVNGSISDVEKVMLSMEGQEIDDKVRNLLLFPPKVVDGKGVKRTVAQVNKEIQDYRKKKLWVILELYLGTDKSNSLFGDKLVLELMGTPEALLKALETDEGIQKLITKINQKFIDICKEYNLFNNPAMFRVKLWRQKETNTFPSIPSGFTKWIESMSVPKANSELYKFTTYELTPFSPMGTINRLSTEAPASDVVAPDVVNTAEDLFKVKDDDSFPSEQMENPVI